MGFTHLLAGGVQAYRRIVADCVPGRWGWPDLSAARAELRLSRQIKRDVGRQNSGPSRRAERKRKWDRERNWKDLRVLRLWRGRAKRGESGRPGSA